jgi:hypothetical protein
MATGESDQIEKVSAGTATDDQDPFIISGSKVLEGMGTYLVTSVGPHSTYGRIMVSLGTESAPTPLQVKLGKLANWIGWFGLGAALLLFFVLLFRFLARLPDNDAPSTVKGQEFMDILIVTVTVIVVAIPGMHRFHHLSIRLLMPHRRTTPGCDPGPSFCDSPYAQGKQSRAAATCLRNDGKRHRDLLG